MQKKSNRKLNFKISGLCLLVGMVTACDDNIATDKNIQQEKLQNEAPTNEELRTDFIKYIKNNMVFIQGGEYMMGGSLSGMYQNDDDFAHKVKLDDFYLSRYITTNMEFRFYLEQMGIKSTDHGHLKVWKALFEMPDYPTIVTWREANNYCSWLADISGLPFSLPTEAQWEFAARNRGQDIKFSTDDGDLHFGENIEFDGQGNIHTDYTGIRGNVSATDVYPVGLFPPNPLGLYDLTSNGHEWMKDWYSPTYYEESPIDNPMGPLHPPTSNAGFDPKSHSVNVYQEAPFKVLRSWDIAGIYGRGNVYIRHFGSYEQKKIPKLSPTVVRCALNTTKIKKN